MTKITLIIEIPDGVEFKIEKLEKSGPKFPKGGEDNEPIKSDSSTKIPDEKPFKTPYPKKRSYKLKGKRICETCKKEFTPRGPRQKYCSEPCRLIPKTKKAKQKQREERLDKALEYANTKKYGKGPGEIPPKVKPDPPKPLPVRQISKTVTSDEVLEKKCLCCGNNFLTLDPKDKFCSARCEVFFKKHGKK